MDIAIATVAVGIVCGLIGIIYWAGQSRDDKQDSRAAVHEDNLKDHIKEDVKVHERVAVLESKVEGHDKLLEGEHGIIKRLHTHGNNITRIIGRLFKEDQGK